MTSQLDQSNFEKLDRIIGYLNFSNGISDPRFLSDFRDLFELCCQQGCVAPKNGPSSGYLESVVHLFYRQIVDRAADLSDQNPAFRDTTQCQQVAELALLKVPLAYREHHSDLLFHQEDEFLFNSFFLGRTCETILSSGDWSAPDVVSKAIHQLNDYIGHRPIPTLESRKIEPYSREFVRPVPIYIQDAGVSEGKYKQIVEGALEVLKATDPIILRAAHFDIRHLKELAVEPRAFEFDHPINRRPNHHFGQWDERSVGQDGLYHRFVIHQVTLNSLLRRVERDVEEKFGKEWQQEDSAKAFFGELTTEASCALAGTMLMAAGICGRGPNAHDSNVTLGSLLPVIAGYRDEFYQQLISQLPRTHRSRLMEEAVRKHQPFGSVRQNLNAELSNCRAAQLVSCRMATIYARMGYYDAAEHQANAVPMASVRIICKIDCLLSSANLTVDAFRDSRLPTAIEPAEPVDLKDAVSRLPEVFSLLKRGIECGAIVDPWNILGFDSNYSLFPALENTVVDNRVYELVDIVERLLYLCSRLWSEAAGSDQQELENEVREFFQEVVGWWRKYAAHEVSSVDAIDPLDIFYAAELVAKALNLWHMGGAEAGDIAFWSNHAGLFDSPKAYALVIDALMQRHDYKTSMALLIHWLSESEFVDLQQGDSSFHDLAFRWIADQRQRLADADAKERQAIWVLIRKFYDYLEANADEYWIVPEFELGETPAAASSGVEETHPENDDFEDYEFDEEDLDDEEDDDSSDDLYGAAYEGVTYLDSTDDGVDGEIFENQEFFESSELEDEVERVSNRLEFIGTLASSWSFAASVPLPRTSLMQKQLEERQSIFEAWIRQAIKNRKKLIELLASIHQYQLPKSGMEPDALHEYDRCRQLKDLLLDRAIRICVETENAIRLLQSVVRAVDQLLTQGPAQQTPAVASGRSPAPDSEAMASTTEPTDSPPPEETPPDPDSVIQIFAAITLRDRDAVVQHFASLLTYMRSQPILYVPLGKGGNPAQIVKARMNQSVMRELLASLPALGLIKETYELTSAALYMERTNPISGGAVTEFDDLFEVAFTSIVTCLVESTSHLKKQLEDDPDHTLEGAPDNPPRDVQVECENILFDCVEKLTESFLIPWLEHNDTLRLSVLERVVSEESWKRLAKFIKTYGDGLFTQPFLQISNLRAILHQGVGKWLVRPDDGQAVPDIRLFDELGKQISQDDAIDLLTLTLEAVLENYGDYQDYNSNTTQSDQGSMLYILLDFLRLRIRYERVCWKLKPVVWAHEVLVREQVNGVAKMWRRNLRERVAPEADKYLAQLQELRVRYSVPMVSIGRRLEERFGHPMQIDRLRALIAPAMKDPKSKRSRRTFEKLQQEVNTFARSMSGVGMELPSWLAAIEHEVEQYFLPERLKDKSLLDHWVEPVVLPIHDLLKQLEKLPVKKILYDENSPPRK